MQKNNHLTSIEIIKEDIMISCYDKNLMLKFF